MSLFKEMHRVSSVGYVETPSPSGEIVHHNDLPFLGSIHHRFFLWTNPDDNSLNILPKYSVLDYLQQYSNFQLTYSMATNNLQDKIVLWNNYYVWSDSDERHQWKMLLHQHEVGRYDLRYPDTYLQLILEGVENSRIATENLIRTNHIILLEYTEAEIQ